MRIVIRTTRGEIDQANVEFFQKRKKPDRLCEVGVGRIQRIYAEPIAVRKQAVVLFWNTGSKLAIGGPLRVMTERDRVKSREPHADVKAGCRRPNPFDDLSQKTRAILKAAAIPPFSSVRPEE